eukprot:3498623-Pleurochrysis_carterae.AAC.2
MALMDAASPFGCSSKLFIPLMQAPWPTPHVRSPRDVFKVSDVPKVPGATAAASCVREARRASCSQGHSVSDCGEGAASFQELRASAGERWPKAPSSLSTESSE